MGSRLYLSRPMGPQDQPDFINAAVGFLTTLSPRELLTELLNIERAHGTQSRSALGAARD